MREEKQALVIVRSRESIALVSPKKNSRKKTHPSAATCPFAFGADTVLTTTVSCCSCWCCCCCCFRETKKVVSHKRAADGKAKRLPDIFFSLTSRRCRSSRRPPVLAPAVSSSVAAVPSPVLLRGGRLRDRRRERHLPCAARRQRASLPVFLFGVVCFGLMISDSIAREALHALLFLVSLPLPLSLSSSCNQLESLTLAPAGLTAFFFLATSWNGSVFLRSFCRGKKRGKKQR